jgi:hypothetical protein
MSFKKPKKSAAKKPPAKQSLSGHRPIAKDSPKGKVAALMMGGTHSFADIAKKIGTTVSNAHQHAKQLKARGFDYTIAEDGTVRLIVPKGMEVFGDEAAKPEKKAKKAKAAAAEPQSPAEPTPKLEARA